jgi:CHAT domain-containing protein
MGSSPALSDLAFQFSERARARAFLDALATGEVQLSDNSAQALVAAEQEAYAVRRAAQDALAKASAANPPDPALATKLKQQLAAAEQSHQEALDAIAQHGGQLAGLVPQRNNSVLDRAAIQKLLDPQTTLVSYYVLDDRTLAFVLTHARFEVVVIEPGLDELRQAIVTLRDFPNKADAHSAAVLQLDAWLLAPLREQNLLTTPHLAIVPHRVLHYLPFAALSDGTRYLIDDYTLTVLPNVSSLPFIQANASHPLAKPLILGNPDGTLRYAQREAQAIAQIYGSQPLLGPAATEAELHEQAAQAGIVHIAAHGRFDPNAPLASSIALASAGDSDGKLEVQEVYGLKLSAAGLVVLSACETQINELNERNVVSAGDEVVGLTRALFFAGTPSVVATLWKVDDAASALLMERFYTHLHDGMGKAAALRQAQQEVREQYPSPYYWAGFVLSGESGPVETGWLSRLSWKMRDAQPWLWLGVAGVTLLAVVAGTVVWYQRRGAGAPQQPLTPRQVQAVGRESALLQGGQANVDTTPAPIAPEAQPQDDTLLASLLESWGAEPQPTLSEKDSLLASLLETLPDTERNA